MMIISNILSNNNSSSTTPITPTTIPIIIPNFNNWGSLITGGRGYREIEVVGKRGGEG